MHFTLISWLMRSHRTVLEHASQCILCRLCPSWERVPCWMLGPFHWRWVGPLFPWSPTVSAAPFVVARGSWDTSPWMRPGYPWHIHHRSIILHCHAAWQRSDTNKIWDANLAHAKRYSLYNACCQLDQQSCEAISLFRQLAAFARKIHIIYIYSWVGTFLSSHIVSSFSFHAPAGLQSATEDETGTERDHWGNWWLQGGWQFGCCWVLLMGKQCFFMFLHSCLKFNFTWDTLSSLCFSGLYKDNLLLCWWQYLAGDGSVLHDRSCFTRLAADAAKPTTNVSWMIVMQVIYTYVYIYII